MLFKMHQTDANQEVRDMIAGNQIIVKTSKPLPEDIQMEVSYKSSDFILKSDLLKAVNRNCSCGGGSPLDGCVACLVYHDLVTQS